MWVQHPLTIAITIVATVLLLLWGIIRLARPPQAPPTPPQQGDEQQ